MIIGCMVLAAIIYIYLWNKNPACGVCGSKMGSEVAFRCRYCLSCGYDPNTFETIMEGRVYE